MGIYDIILPDITRWFGHTGKHIKTPNRTMCIPWRDTIAGGYGIISPDMIPRWLGGTRKCNAALCTFSEGKKGAGYVRKILY